MSPFLHEGEYVLVYDLQISIAALEFTHDMYAFLCGSFQSKTALLSIKNKYATRNINQWNCQTQTNKNLIYTHLKSKQILETLP